MDTNQHSFENFGLQRAAAAGDDEGVRQALHSGADVNALNIAGKTALMSAIAGDNWENLDAFNASFMTSKRLDAIRVILNHPHISLLTLNLPHHSMNGTIPLGMAAWLNMPEVVRLLLEESADCVSVDGMDCHGATALMYAARDGGLDVVQILLSHGARPDFRDRNHRTSIQFALAHPQILWLCETVLRRHRRRESQSADRGKLFSESKHILELASASAPSSDDLEPPQLSIFTNEATSRLTNTLISSIRTSDLAFIHSVLFSPPLPPSAPAALYPMSVPALVNLPDSKGWSLIHHCVAVESPSIEILDTLYYAGADMALFTTHEQRTPLHILAQSAPVLSGQPDHALSLYNFVVHLLRDLRAPFSAKDKWDETCIHVAAEHGNCFELLMFFLDFDSTGSVREQKNSRGLTALEVAKPEFLIAFGENTEKTRSVSALSNHTIKPTDSFASLASFSGWSDFITVQDDTASLYTPSSLDVAVTAQLVLSNLRRTSPVGRHHNDSAYLAQLDELLTETTQQSQTLVQHFRNKAKDALKEIAELRKSSERIDALRNAVSHAARGKLAVRGISPIPPKKRYRDSEDSQTTIVSTLSEYPADWVPAPPNANNRRDVATQTTLLDVLNMNPSATSRSNPAAWTSFLENFVHNDDPSMYKSYLAGLWEVNRELEELEEKVTPSDIYGQDYGSTKSTIDSRVKHLLKKKKKLEDKLKELESEQKGEKKGTSRLKAWLKRVVLPVQHQTKLELVLDVDEERCNVGTEISQPRNCLPAQEVFDASIDGALRTSQLVLHSAWRDLKTVQDCLASAEQLIESANSSITRAERVIKRAVKKRKAMLAKLRKSEPGAQWADGDIVQQQDLDAGSPDLLGYSNIISLRPSLASISSMQSTCSSIVSVAATLTENDDEDTRIVRRLLLRKIEAQTSGAWDEVEKVVGWLRVVKEVVRGIKRRAYL